MNGILAQTAALAAHARARRLDAKLGGDESYWATHSTFRYVRSLAFKVREPGLFRTTERVIATAPAGWLQTLHASSTAIFVSLGASGPLEAHIASAFVGGTHEGIAISTLERQTLWVPGWNVVGQYPDNRIWAVTYLGQPVPGLNVSNKTLNVARGELSEALRQAHEFATSDSSLHAWRDTFEKALGSLDASEPIAPYHPDILPRDGYSLGARQLLAASVGGFVFGGMGSWNDSGFSDPELHSRYETVTRRLYQAVMEGLVAAVNEGSAAEGRLT